MPMSETMRKQSLIAEVAILISGLNEVAVADSQFPMPSHEDFGMMSVADLDSMKRELQTLCRSLGGVKVR